MSENKVINGVEKVISEQASRFESAVIWCRRFSVSFGAAALAPA